MKNSIKNEEAPNYSAIPAYSASLEINRDDVVIGRALSILEKRLERPENLVVTCPKDVSDFLTLKLAEKEHEVFAIMFLDNRHRLICYEELFQGTIDGASVYPREVLKAALKHNAAALILSHNHPSGVPNPSEADKRITRRLKEVLSLVDIRLLDHIIVGGTNTLSFDEEGLL